MQQPNTPRFVFFGSSQFSTFVLEELEKRGLLPALLVTGPDAPKGRKLVLTPPVTKDWADKHSIPVFQPEKLTSEAAGKLKENGGYDFFIVASYGIIIPQAILDLPKHGTLNVHPSLLPKYRGASPLQSAILDDAQETGVTIIVLDAEMDHGPIVAQKKVAVPGWPVQTEALEELLAREGGALLAESLAAFLSGELKPVPQNDTEASFTKKISKANGFLDLSADARKNFLKIKAYSGWPSAYFFAEKNGKQIRVIVKDAEFENGVLKMTRVLPEGKKEMSWSEYEQYLGESR